MELIFRSMIHQRWSAVLLQKKALYLWANTAAPYMLPEISGVPVPDICLAGVFFFDKETYSANKDLRDSGEEKR